LRLPGPVKEVFADRVRSAFPDRADAIFARIRETRGDDGRVSDPRFGARMVGSGPRWEAIRQLFELWTRKLGYAPRPASGPTTFRRPSKPTMQLALW
jgi:hypothetical protein